MKPQSSKHRKISTKLWLWSIGLVIPFIVMSGLLMRHEYKDISHIALDMAILFAFTLIIVFILVQMIMKKLLNPKIGRAHV